MIWEEVLVDRALSPEEITRWVTSVFHVLAEDVVVMPENSPEGVGDDVLVVGETAPAEGDFTLRISVFVRREDLEARDSTAAIATLCGQFDVNALVSDDTANPYRMIHVSKTGERRPVHLDVDELDERERYVIASFEQAN